jgi:radical SAM superfamily enzyme YgiQ (UPF0313 family)
MRESGCRAVFLGIESGDPGVLLNMNKKATPERYRYGIGRLNAVGIASLASVIIGFPGETESSIRTTMELIETTHPTFFNAQLYYHDLQSPIHHRAAEFGLKGAGYSWTQRTMNWQEAASWARTVFKEVTSSTPLTLDGMSMWVFTYLTRHGIDIPVIRQFGEIARPMLTAGFDEREVEAADYQKLVALFSSPVVRDSLTAGAALAT